MKSGASSLTSKLGMLIWVLAIAGGLGALLRYAGTPGTEGIALQKWPAASFVTTSSRAQLLVFLHPECPCSKATVGELDRLLPALQNRVDVHVLFADIESKEKTENSSLWLSAKNLKGVRSVSIDTQASESILFGAQTSGQTYLYDPSGDLIFSGGITPSRGHMGDSVGRETILSWLEKPEKKFVHSPSFGCALRKVATITDSTAP